MLRNTLQLNTYRVSKWQGCKLVLALFARLHANAKSAARLLARDQTNTQANTHSHTHLPQRTATFAA